jgi:hypothetical protein
VNGDFLDEVVFGMLVEEWGQLNGRELRPGGGSGAEQSRLEDIDSDGSGESSPADDGGLEV